MRLKLHNQICLSLKGGNYYLTGVFKVKFIIYANPVDHRSQTYYPTSSCGTVVVTEILQSSHVSLRCGNAMLPAYNKECPKKYPIKKSEEQTLSLGTFSWTPCGSGDTDQVTRPQALQMRQPIALLPLLLWTVIYCLKSFS